MIVELLYTSASQGLKQGSKGFCTVLSTVGLPGNLALRLEALSGYRHVFQPGEVNADQNPVSYSHLRLMVGGRNVSILSRVSAYGVDYSQRSNKLAHHIAADEALPQGGPVPVLKNSSLMRSKWSGDCETPSMGPHWNDESVLPRRCELWDRVTGDAGWAGPLIEAWSTRQSKPVWIIFSLDQSSRLLDLIGEAIALLPEPKRWSATFSTYFTSLPPDVDCKVRCVLAGTEEARLAIARGIVVDLTKQLPRATDTVYAIAAREGDLLGGVSTANTHASTSEDLLPASVPPDLLSHDASRDADLRLQDASPIRNRFDGLEFGAPNSFENRSKKGKKKWKRSPPAPKATAYKYLIAGVCFLFAIGLLTTVYLVINASRQSNIVAKLPKDTIGKGKEIANSPNEMIPAKSNPTNSETALNGTALSKPPQIDLPPATTTQSEPKEESVIPTTKVEKKYKLALALECETSQDWFGKNYVLEGKNIKLKLDFKDADDSSNATVTESPKFEIAWQFPSDANSGMWDSIPDATTDAFTPTLNFIHRKIRVRVTSPEKNFDETSVEIEPLPMSIAMDTTIDESFPFPIDTLEKQFDSNEPPSKLFLIIQFNAKKPLKLVAIAKGKNSGDEASEKKKDFANSSESTKTETKIQLEPEGIARGTNFQNKTFTKLHEQERGKYQCYYFSNPDPTQLMSEKLIAQLKDDRKKLSQKRMTAFQNLNKLQEALRAKHNFAGASHLPLYNHFSKEAKGREWLQDLLGVHLEFYNSWLKQIRELATVDLKKDPNALEKLKKDQISKSKDLGFLEWTPEKAKQFIDEIDGETVTPVRTAAKAIDAFIVSMNDLDSEIANYRKKTCDFSSELRIVAVEQNSFSKDGKYENAVSIPVRIYFPISAGDYPK